VKWSINEFYDDLRNIILSPHRFVQLLLRGKILEKSVKLKDVLRKVTEYCMSPNHVTRMGILSKASFEAM